MHVRVEVKNKDKIFCTYLQLYEPNGTSELMQYYRENSLSHRTAVLSLCLIYVLNIGLDKVRQEQLLRIKFPDEFNSAL